VILLSWYGSVGSLWAEFGGESVLVVAVAGLAMVVAAPARPVLDIAAGARRGRQPERGDDQAVEQAAELASGQRDRAAMAGVVPGICWRRWRPTGRPPPRQERHGMARRCCPGCCGAAAVTASTAAAVPSLPRK
jgi:hypothetical protein